MKDPKRQWRFPSNGGGELTGFNNGAIDSFKGNRLSSTVREVIQNSLDAEKINSEEPIGVAFRIHRIKRENAPEITFLKKHLIACREVAERQKRESAVKYYLNAITRIENDEEIKILAIHDYNSRGLTGDVDDETGAWSALVKGTGLSQKPAGSLGSFGHGSKAPFSLSDIRTVFYLSFVETDGVVERRFQGKSILQSHSIDDSDDRTQGTGYFGWASERNCAPLLNDEIPQWATNLREDVDGLSGTTIIIPYFNLSESELPETAISCISNFYYAIWKANLKINIFDETELNCTNIKSKYFDYKNRLKDERDYIDYERISDNFDSLMAVVEPDDNGITEVHGLDSFEWYIKLLDDEHEKRTRVVIARKDGMLIKHNPVKLERFQLVKPFEMFVCVNGARGSDLLKSIENPTHDDFEFDRIDDLTERKKAKADYDRIAKKIRSIVNRIAEITSEAETADSTLNKWFRPSVIDDKPGEGVERGEKVTISRISSFNRRKSSNNFKPGDGNIVTLEGQGFRSGQGKKQSDGGTIPGPGTGIISGKGKKDSSKNTYKSLENLRILPTRNAENRISLIFDNPGEGEHLVVIEKVGEEGRERVNVLIANDIYSDQISATFDANKRQSLTVESNERLAGYALEARVVLSASGGASDE
ncbi:hypothetical protein N9Z60_04905 [Gammaproteobacteria bacterium]|nr:hypothetical protein [Gammaproteobacteria bacterium]